ncbi:MAG: glycosyltransferase family 4 protein [Bacteroidia bacterium]|nr:glycosyltransferase family 4 protein [Bacteroidia bacterium]
MSNQQIKIAYLSSNNPQDIHAWSGIHYSIFQSLNKHIGKVTALGPYKNNFVDFLIKAKKIFYKIVFNKRYNQYHSNLLAKDYGKYFNEKIREDKYNLIVAVSASAELAYLETDVPVVFISDALFTNSLNYYTTLSNLCKASLKEGYDTEGKALRKSSLLYLPSEWAANAAINDFTISKDKIVIAPMGANLTDIPTTEFVLNYKKQKNNSVLNLVFVGVNWDNKGGQKAYDCLLEILDSGQKAELTIVGCKIPESITHKNLKNIPFIRKTTTEGKKQFEELYLNADFLILPTKFEAFGIVFCEAAAYGVISIANNTGGTPTSVKENGILMNVNADAKNYADEILSVYNNKQKFSEMKIAARERYNKELNWDSWAINLKKVLIEKQLI